MLLLCFQVSCVHAWKMEAGEVSLPSTGGESQLFFSNFQQTYDTTPIVVALMTTRGGEESALRISDVTTTGFRMAQMEPFSSDGAHVNVTVSYIAIEQGSHMLPDGRMIEAGAVSTSEIQFNGNPPGRKGWEPVSFSNSFTNPMLLADIQTTNNELGIQPRNSSVPWLTVAVDSLSNTAVDLALERSELYDSTSGPNFNFNDLGSDETIGYIVMDGNVTGNFNVDGNRQIAYESRYVSGAADGWDNGCDSINFLGAFSSTPLAVATKSSHLDDDGGWLRECSKNSSRIQLTIDEDRAQDSERSHPAEDVSLLVFSDAFFYDSNAVAAPTSDSLILESGSVVLDPSQFNTVTFQQVYDIPPAVFVLADDNNSEPTQIRIRNVTTTGFQAVAAEAPSTFDAPDQNTTMHYLAVTYGNHSFPDGTNIQVSSIDLRNFQTKLNGSSSWLGLNFSSAFSSTPAVIAGVQTMNNEPSHTPGSASSPWLSSAIRNVNSSGLEIALERAEVNSGTVSLDETMAYLSVLPGSLTTFRDNQGNDVDGEFVRSSDSIEGWNTCGVISFFQSYPASPLVVGVQNTRDGGDGGWLRRCSISNTSVELSVDEDVNNDGERNHTTERAGLAVFSQTFAADFGLIASWRFDRNGWSNGPNEVTDYGPYSNNGTPNNDLTTSPAAYLCRAAELDGVDDYIEAATAVDTLRDTASLSFWVKTTQTGDNTAWRAPGVAGVEQSGGTDDIFWGWIDATGRIGISAGDDNASKSNTPINDDVYHHVVLTRDATSGEYKIYIDGILDKSGTTGTGVIGSTFSSLGRIEAGAYFQGFLDEVKIYDRVLSDGQVQRLFTETRGCPSCNLSRFEISQPTYALACPATRAEITITAKCSDGSNKTDYLGTTDLTGPAGSSFFDASTGGSGITSASYASADQGVKSVYLYFDDENSDVRVTATDVVESVSDTASTGTDFLANGFRFTTQPQPFVCGATPSSDTTTTATLQAYGQTNDSAGASCEVLTGFSGNKTLDAWFRATTNDDGTADTVSTSMLLNSTSVSAQTSSANDNLTLNFNNGEASFSIAYLNAAQILDLNFRYDSAPYDGSVFPEIAASSSSFSVRPETLLASASSGGTTVNSISESGGTTHPAGDAFVLDVTAQCNGGSVATDYQPTADSNRVMAYVQRTGPTGGSASEGQMNVSTTATLTTQASGSPSWSSAEMAQASFTGGRYSYANASYSEVGLTRLWLRDQNYFGEVIPASTVNIGRFIPDYFEVSTTSGTLDAFCSPASGAEFSYLGQDFGYFIAPTATIIARNAVGDTTENYTEPNYLKLSAPDVARTLPSADNNENGSDGVTPLSVTSTQGATGAFTAVANGQMTYSFPADSFRYNRDSNALVAPFMTDLTVSIDSIIDDDGVSASLASYPISPIAIQQRYGRWALDNAFGPETTPLSIPQRVEFWDGVSFEVNTVDGCTTYDASNMTLAPSLSNGGSTSASGADTLIDGEAPLASAISLSAPGANSTGTVGLTYQSDTWLRFDWDNNAITVDEDPSATATFGQYRGHDRIIYWREVSP